MRRLAPLLVALASACGAPSAATDASAGGDAAWRDAGSAGTDSGSGCTPVDFVAAMADPLAPARRLPGRAFLVSSRSPEPQPGMHNDDFAHFIGFDGPRAILADETGPGVITRLWFTYGPPMIGTISGVPLRLSIDGHDVIVDRPLGELAGAASDTFPAPWSMDPAIASGGLVISSPIAFQQSAVVELTIADGSWAYYQVDVRRLPTDVCVRSWDGAYTPAERVALADAATIWSSHEHPGDDHTVATHDVGLGGTTELTLTGPGVITTLEVVSLLGARGTIGLRIEVDGEVAAEAPLAWLTGSDAPAGLYTAALTASSTESAFLYAPIPFASSARVVVTNGTDAVVPIGLRARVLAMAAIPSDVGRFHAECGSASASIPVASEQPPFADEFPNIVLAHAARGPGQFAGLTTFQRAPDPWWWCLEPDHEVSIDGNYDILGTGTEDYFGGAFYFMNGPYASVTSGASGWTRPDGTTHPTPDASTHLYRHHIVDGWPYDRELSFEIESYVNGLTYESCAFFYEF